MPVKRYDEMTKQELWDAMQTSTPKELREIHRCLKKYDDEVPFRHRFPYFLPSATLMLAGIDIVLAIIALVMKLCLLAVQ